MLCEEVILDTRDDHFLFHDFCLTYRGADCFSDSGGSTGALLPYIERAYHFGYAQVSVLFVCTFLGYVVSAATAGTLTRRIGYGHTMLISTTVELAGVCLVLFLSWYTR